MLSTCRLIFRKGGARRCERFSDSLSGCLPQIRFSLRIAGLSYDTRQTIEGGAGDSLEAGRPLSFYPSSDCFPVKTNSHCRIVEDDEPDAAFSSRPAPAG